MRLELITVLCAGTQHTSIVRQPSASILPVLVSTRGSWLLGKSAR